VFHLLYILAFTCLAFLAVGNLIRNLIRISADYQYSGSSYNRYSSDGNTPKERRQNQVPHPEFLDESGNVIDEPLLVMKSIGVEDARKQLEYLYENPPENSAS